MALTQGGVQEVWQGEQAQRVPGGRRVEDDAREVRVLGALGDLHHAADGDRLIHARRQRVQQLACRSVQLVFWTTPITVLRARQRP